METKERSLKLLGFFGIVGETFKIIHSQTKLLGTITLALILPCVFITLVKILVATHTFYVLFPHRFNEPWSVIILRSTEFAVVELLWAILFYAALIPSIAAVVYTVAGVYKGEGEKPTTTVMRPAPAVWKCMLITSLWYFISNFLMIVACAFLLFLALIIPFSLYFLVPCFGLVLVGVYLYVRMIWQVAIVVSVMEEGCYGWEGIKKSRSFIHGKQSTAWAIIISYMTVDVLFNYGAVMGDFEFVELWVRIFYGASYLMLLSVIILMWEVTQSVLYFVCKSHHGDDVDKGCSLESCSQGPPVESAGGNLSLDSNKINMGRQNWLTC